MILAKNKNISVTRGIVILNITNLTDLKITNEEMVGRLFQSAGPSEFTDQHPDSLFTYDTYHSCELTQKQ